MIENIITPTPINGVLDHSTPPIIDRFGRSFNYLRLALNEQCNLRCIYCMPEEGIDFRSEDKLLTTEEIFRLIKILPMRQILIPYPAHIAGCRK